MKKKLFVILPVLAMLTLAGCGGSKSSSTSSKAGSSSTPASSSKQSSSKSSEGTSSKSSEASSSKSSEASSQSSEHSSSSSQEEQYDYYVTINGNKIGLEVNPQATGETLIAEYIAFVDVTVGDTIDFVSGAQELVKGDTFAIEEEGNNLTGINPGPYTVLCSATNVPCCLKLYNTPWTSVYLGGYSSPVVSSEFKMSINGGDLITMTSSEETPEGWVSQSEAGPMAVTAGDTVTFSLDDAAITVIAEDNANNNVKMEDSSIKVVKSAESATFYLKKSQTGDYVLWCTGNTYVPDPTASKFQLSIGGVVTNLTHNEEPLDPSFDEWYVCGVNIAKDDVIKAFDSENNVTFAIATLNDASSAKFEKVGDDIVCLESGCFDVYFKFKNEADEVYIGEQETAKEYKFAIGQAEGKAMTKSSGELPSGVSSQYEFKGEKLLAEDVITFSCNGTALEGVVPSEGDTNNVTVKANALTIVKSADSADIYLKVLSTGDIEVWVTGNGYEPDPAFGDFVLVVNETKYKMELNEEPQDPSFTEWFAKNVSIAQNDIVKAFDNKNGVTFAVKTLDPSSSDKFEVVEEGLKCKEASCFDIYFKFKSGEDQVYIGEVLNYRVRVADMITGTLTKSEQTPEGCSAQYELEGQVQAGYTLAFTLNGKAIEVAIDTSKDNNVKLNDKGQVVVIKGGTCTIYLKVLTEGGYVIYGTGNEYVPDPTASDFQLVINEVKMNLTHNETPLEGFDEWFATNVSLAKDDVLTAFNAKTGEAFSIKVLDEASSKKFEVVDSGIKCKEAGKFDIYFKFKFNEDQVYIGEVIEPMTIKVDLSKLTATHDHLFAYSWTEGLDGSGKFVKVTNEGTVTIAGNATNLLIAQSSEAIPETITSDIWTKVSWQSVDVTLVGLRDTFAFKGTKAEDKEDAEMTYDQTKKATSPSITCTPEGGEACVIEHASEITAIREESIDVALAYQYNYKLTVEDASLPFLFEIGEENILSELAFIENEADGLATIDKDFKLKFAKEGVYFVYVKVAIEEKGLVSLFIKEEKVEPVIVEGYYISGSMTSWKVDAEYLLSLNDKSQDEEYFGTFTFEVGDVWKICDETGTYEGNFKTGSGSAIDAGQMKLVDDGFGGKNCEVVVAGEYTIYYKVTGNDTGVWIVALAK